MHSKCRTASKPESKRSRAASGHAAPAVGYHLIIYDFRSINHLINKT